MKTIAALFVERDGVYYGQRGIDPWDKERDALLYRGPNPVVAHPECQRWGRFSEGSTRRVKQFFRWDDGGVFFHALWAVRTFGGVLEHPKDSQAFRFFGMQAPPYQGGWVEVDDFGGWACCVEQGHYGHFSRKPTWLYANGAGGAIKLPELIWGRSEQRLPAYAVERYGYEKARRIGVMAAVGGKDKTKIRNGTPPRISGSPCPGGKERS